jgi:hypothetical protein
MNSIGLSILIAVGGIISFAPKRWAIQAILAGVLYLTYGQRVVFLGFNLFPLRLIELAACVRVYARREFPARWNSVDRALLIFYSYTTIVFLFRSSEGIAYQIGLAVDAVLCYFSFRSLVNNEYDVKLLLSDFTWLLIPFAGFVLVERLTGRNYFTLLGGINWNEAFVRDGKPRCFGSFNHPSLLGTLGATFLPLYTALCFIRRTAAFGFAGTFACLIIVWSSNSGGPLSTAAFTVIGWTLWRYRSRMSIVRGAVVFGFAFLTVIMKAPIWYVLSRLSSITGGDGWHRSYLLDKAFSHFGDWWLAGIAIHETANWFPYTLTTTGSADITNQFLVFAFQAGIGALALFLLLLVRGFSQLGKAMALARLKANDADGAELLLWGLGVSLFGHITNWLGISYFDQSYAIWFLHLALIATITERFCREQPVPATSQDVVSSDNRAVSSLPWHTILVRVQDTRF